MLSEYYKRPDLQPFQDGWYRTGDMGYIADGEVYIVGRLKDLIINAGKNIYPQDIEAIVNTVQGVYPGRAVVFGVADEREGTELIGVVAEVTTDDAQERKHIAHADSQHGGEAEHGHGDVRASGGRALVDQNVQRQDRPRGESREVVGGDAALTRRAQNEYCEQQSHSANSAGDAL